jgi:hypothetical protein
MKRWRPPDHNLNMRGLVAEERVLLTAREAAFRKCVAYLKAAILALKSTSQFSNRPEEETRLGLSHGLGQNFFGAAARVFSPPVIHWNADTMRVNAYAASQRECEHAALLMTKYFIFERLESGRLLWMGDAEDLEDAEAKLQNLAESNPGCDYFAFDVETRTKIRIESHDDPA